jgi:hypothetical protein
LVPSELCVDFGHFLFFDEIYLLKALVHEPFPLLGGLLVFFLNLNLETVSLIHGLVLFFSSGLIDICLLDLSIKIKVIQTFL